MHEKLRLIVEGLIALLLLVLVAQAIRIPASTLIGTSYQAVFLTDGQVFFGKLDSLDSPWPVLRDVYFLQQRGTNDAGQKEQRLVKRSQVLHQPDHMLLNAAQIKMVEPVSEGSKMIQLIRAASQPRAEMLDDLIKQ